MRTTPYLRAGAVACAWDTRPEDRRIYPRAVYWVRTQEKLPPRRTIVCVDSSAFLALPSFQGDRSIPKLPTRTRGNSIWPAPGKTNPISSPILAKISLLGQLRARLAHQAKQYFKKHNN